MVVKPYHINLNLYHYAGNNPVRYVDPDGRSPLSWFIPNPEKFSTQEAQDWIDKFVCSNKFFPICAALYSKSRNGDTSSYVKGIDSPIAKAMASDKKAYVNQIIEKRLKEGKTSGENGRTEWSKLDLKLSIGSSNFSWKLESYDSETLQATVSVKITDNFDFNKGNGVRSTDAEKLTSLGRKAQLAEFDIEVEYMLNIKVKMGEN